MARASFVTRLAAGAATLAAVACNTAAGPDAGERVYVLRTVGGRSLPTVYAQNELVTIRVLADTIRLSDKGTGRWVRLQRTESAVTLPPGVLTRRYDSEFDYTLLTRSPAALDQPATTRISISLPCPPNASCVAPPHFVGNLTPSTLELDHALGARVPLRYERVAERLPVR
jgi:hypothetical protein